MYLKYFKLFLFASVEIISKCYDFQADNIYAYVDAKELSKSRRIF